MTIFVTLKNRNMIGTLINTVTILTGSIVGGLARKGIRKKYSDVLYTGLGLAVLLLGANATVSHLPKSNYPVLFICSLAIGGVIGTALNLHDHFQKAISKVSKGELAQGLSTGVLLYCIGTLSMVGPIMSALYADNTYLYTNAMLDLVTSAVLASTYGFGMILAAPILFLWQGSIYLIALYARSFISDDMMTEMSVVGGALITASGLSILKIKDCKIVNLMPALFIPVVFFAIKRLLGL